MLMLMLQGGEPGDQAAGQLHVQARRLHLPQHPLHCPVRVAPLHHLLSPGADGHHLPTHQAQNQLPAFGLLELSKIFRFFILRATDLTHWGKCKFFLLIPKFGKNISHFWIRQGKLICVWDA